MDLLIVVSPFVVVAFILYPASQPIEVVKHMAASLKMAASLRCGDWKSVFSKKED